MLFKIVENYKDSRVWLSVELTDEETFEPDPNMQAQVVNFFETNKKLAEIKQIIGKCKTMVCAEDELNKAGIVFKEDKDANIEKGDNNESN